MKMMRWRDAVAKGSRALPAYGVGRRGIGSDIVLATGAGWRPVGGLSVGQDVLTFDGGLRRIIALRAEPAWAAGLNESDLDDPCPPSLWPIEVPRGALGNREVMLLAADQPVLIESDTAESETGDPFAMMPARALEGVRGICRVPPGPAAALITLTFEVEQIVFGAGGAMLHCPAPAPDLLDAAAPLPRYALSDFSNAVRLARAMGPVPAR